MHLSQLQIFSKKRDAAAVLRGYEFQHLKTLKTWVENRVNNVDEWIYCDFEEDIFQRDVAREKIRFRQIKLYSTDFSFSSPAIRDTIANFFMLYVKGDYLFDTVAFSFETNASVVPNERRGNDAELLRELSQGWEGMSDERKTRARERVRVLLQEYIDQQVADRVDGPGLRADVDRAREIFATLPDDVLDRFISSIQWQFDGLSSNEAVDKLRDEILGLIEQLPLPEIGPASVAFSVLYTVVSNRSTQEDPEDRKLETSDLDMVLLHSGDDKDQWYAAAFEKWSPVISIPAFYSGQFYEIVDASRYYRMNMYEAGHNGMWMRVLDMYIDNPAVEVKYKRKAIYEYLFLSLHPDPLSARPVTSFRGQEERIRFYFGNRDAAASEEQIQEDRTLFSIVTAQAGMGNVDLDGAELAEWGAGITDLIDSRLGANPRVDERCRLLELKGDFQLNMEFAEPGGRAKPGLDTFREIVALLPQAVIYSIQHLVETVEAYALVLVRAGGHQEMVREMEQFLEEARGAAQQAKGRHETAHDWVEKGVRYLEGAGLDNALEALNCFHRAKSLWLADHTMEGHVLALLNIAGIYGDVLGMNLAAKYHAFCAIWATWHSRDESKFARLAQATGFLFKADFQQGAWVCATDVFEMFIRARQDWNPEGWQGDQDEMFSHTMTDMTFLVFAAKQFRPDMEVYFNFRTSKWGPLLDGYLQPLVANMEKLMNEGHDIKKVARGHLTDEPLSDVGPTRVIAFNALGIQWVIEVENTYAMNAIAEEFTCMLQIFLCEIARVKKGLLRTGITVHVSVLQSPDYDTIKKHETEDDWLAPIPEFHGKERGEIGRHGAFLAIMIKELLREYVAVSNEEFETLWTRLLEKEMVGEKVSGVNPYQKVYYNAVAEEVFSQAQRTAFTSPAAERIFDEGKPLLV